MFASNSQSLSKISINSPFSYHAPFSFKIPPPLPPLFYPNKLCKQTQNFNRNTCDFGDWGSTDSFEETKLKKGEIGEKIHTVSSTHSRLLSSHFYTYEVNVPCRWSFSNPPLVVEFSTRRFSLNLDHFSSSSILQFSFPHRVRLSRFHALAFLPSKLRTTRSNLRKTCPPKYKRKFAN